MSDQNNQQNNQPNRNGQRPQRPLPPPTPMRTWLMVLLMMGIAIIGVSFLFQDNLGTQTKPGPGTPMEHVKKGNVDKIVFKPDGAIHMKVAGEEKLYSYDVNKAYQDEFVKMLMQKGDKGEVDLAAIELEYEEESQLLGFFMAYIFPLLLIVLVIYLLFARQMRTMGGSGMLSFGKSRAKLWNKETSRVSFDNVAGIDEAKDEVTEIITFLKNPKKFQRLGGRIPKGVLLVGPPGTGKTLLAKAIAGEADVPFFSICGSDFVEMFVGVGASRVRDLFRQAKESSPCIIFLDEIDAVGRRRGQNIAGGGHDEREQTLNAILVEMDGFETDEKVIVISATNRQDVLDPALLRPGRFDRSIVLEMPDLKGREAILKVHSKKVKLSPDVSLKTVARGTPGCSGADLEAIINEAAILATMRESGAVELQDLEEARDRVMFGRQKSSRVIDPEERRVTAYHEGGHALVAKLRPEVEPLHKVTIIPRGRALGATMQLPERDKYVLSRKSARGQIMTLLAGRISEQLFFEDISSGAAQDIREATNLARLMVKQWGMSEKIGMVFYDEGQANSPNEYAMTKPFSESTAVMIDEEVHRLIDECYREVQQLLTDNKDNLKRVAESLLDREVLTAIEVDTLLSGGELPPLESEPSHSEPKGQPVPEPTPDEKPAPEAEPPLGGLETSPS